MKNENGSGTIYKLSGKRKKPWAVMVTIGYDSNGKQQRKIVGTYETKRDGQKALFDYINNPTLFSKKSFGEIKRLWWETYTKRVTHKTTINTHIYRMKALEPLDNLEIADIKLFQVQKLFDSFEYSWSFKNGCKSVLSMIFDFALKNDFIDSNKIKFVEIGKKEKIIERRIFTKDEIEILWSNSKEPYVYIVLILIYTGMRIGEFMNLKNNEIDLIKRSLKINESKTENGLRTIPISSKIYDLIKDNMIPGQEYFLKGDTTTQLSYSTFKPRFQKLLKRLGIESHTIHDTRHTFATLLNNANANPTSITLLVGHSDFAMTENIYTHKTTEELRKAVELIN